MYNEIFDWYGIRGALAIFITRLRICKFCLDSEGRNLGRKLRITSPKYPLFYIIDIEIKRIDHIFGRVAVRQPKQSICIMNHVLLIISIPVGSFFISRFTQIFRSLNKILKTVP